MNLPSQAPIPLSLENRLGESGLFVKEVTVEVVIFGYLGMGGRHSQPRKVRNVKARMFSAHKANREQLTG